MSTNRTDKNIQSILIFASHSSSFNFLLQNISHPGHYFGARCFLSALHDSSVLDDETIFDLYASLESYYGLSVAEREAAKRRAQRLSAADLVV